MSDTTVFASCKAPVIFTWAPTEGSGNGSGHVQHVVGDDLFLGGCSPGLTFLYICIAS